MDIQAIRRAAIADNNEGVRLLREGDLASAILKIARGLEMMKAILEEPADIRIDVHSEEVSDELLSVEDLNLAFMETSFGDAAAASCYQQQSSYVFCSPIEIPIETSLLPLKISLLMVFNLALAHHLNGIQTSNCDHLEKALRLYECVYRISQEEEVGLSVLHAMALTNNLGHVHLVLRDTFKSQKCFEQLLATLIYFVEVSDGDSNEIKSLMGFFSNATGFSMKKSSAPAA
jgi:tetratricopeptide (TPR) repeat protein